MKLLGAGIILFCTLYGYLQYRRQKQFVLQLGRILLRDLAVIRFEICIRRRSLPDILTCDVIDGLGNEILWKPFVLLLGEKDGIMTIQQCWEDALERLPQMLRRRLYPLGSLLSIGGSHLEQLIDEVRRELLEDLCREERQQRMSFRIAGAMCFSGACFLILVLI